MWSSASRTSTDEPAPRVKPCPTPARNPGNTLAQRPRRVLPQAASTPHRSSSTPAGGRLRLPSCRDRRPWPCACIAQRVGRGNIALPAASSPEAHGARRAGGRALAGIAGRSLGHRDPARPFQDRGLSALQDPAPAEPRGAGDGARAAGVRPREATIGTELEMFLVDREARPVPIGAEIARARRAR